MLMSILRAMFGLARMLGRLGSESFIVSIFAGITLAAVETSLAFLIPLILRVLNITSAAGPVEFFVNWMGEYLPIFVVLAFPTLAAIRAIMFYVIEMQCCRVEELMKGRLRQVAIYRLLNCVNENYLSASDINSLLSYAFPSAASITREFISLIPYLLNLSLIFTVMLVTKPYQSIFAAAGVIGIGIIFYRTSIIVRNIAGDNHSLQKLLAKTLMRLTQNWLLIRSSNLQDRELASISAINSKSYNKMLSARSLSAMVVVIPTFLGTCLVSVLIFIQLQKSSPDSLHFVAMLYLLMRFVDSLSRVTGCLSRIAPNLPGYFKAAEVFFATSKADREIALSSFHQALEQKPVPLSNSKIGSPSLAPTISVSNLHYSHPGTTRELFRGLSFEISGGAQMGLVGPSGSGKSTLLCLILGILRQNSGDILINGKPVLSGQIREEMTLGFVSAEPFLFGGSVKENLDYGQNRILDNSDYFEALSKVRLLSGPEQVESFLLREIRDDLSGFSMGEKQRLCLARALLRQPNVIILDEVSANLDWRTEQEISSLLNDIKGLATVIIVSHRPNILLHADFILDLSTNVKLSVEEFINQQADWGKVPSNAVA